MSEVRYRVPALARYAAYMLGVRHATDGVPHPGYCRTADASRRAMRHFVGALLGYPGDAPDDVTDYIADAYERGRISTLPAVD
jgi:hypothetical protein